MNINFNELPWHDANLRFIYIDRQKPGEQDSIRLVVDWPDLGMIHQLLYFTIATRWI